MGKRIKKDRYRELFERSADAILIIVGGKFVDCNESTVKMLRYMNKKDLLDTHPSQLSPERQPDGRLSHEKANEMISIALEKGSNRFEWDHVRANGEVFPVEVLLTALVEDDHPAIHVVWREISDRKKAEEARQKAYVELEQRVDERTAEIEQANKALKDDIEEKERTQAMLSAANAELERVNLDIKAAQSQLLQGEKMASIGQLAAGVAHEINNPVGFIHSNLSTLAKYLGRFAEYMAAQQAASVDLAEDVRQLLAVKAKALKIDYITADAKDLVRECLEGTERVKEITMNLKNFSRIDHQEQQAANLNTCLDETLHIVWNELKYKATVIKDYGDLPETVCFPQQLNQVFVNILVNAAQAMVDKGEIRIRTRAADGSIFVAISDTGPGIPESIRHRLFEPFFTTKEVGKGTGLGLSISYDIIKKHGGEITIDSEEGRGTTFTFQIPVRARDETIGEAA